MNYRNYKSAKDASKDENKSDNPTLDFFIAYLNAEDEDFNLLKDEICEFVIQGFEAEGRNLDLALPNAIGFLFVLKTSQRDIPKKTIFDALEASISNPNYTDADVSRVAWGIVRRIVGWAK